jgi:hypothetical protein
VCGAEASCWRLRSIEVENPDLPALGRRKPGKARPSRPQKQVDALHALGVLDCALARVADAGDALLERVRDCLLARWGQSGVLAARDRGAEEGIHGCDHVVHAHVAVLCGARARGGEWQARSTVGRGGRRGGSCVHRDGVRQKVGDERHAPSRRVGRRLGEGGAQAAARLALDSGSGREA